MKKWKILGTYLLKDLDNIICDVLLFEFKNYVTLVIELHN